MGIEFDRQIAAFEGACLVAGNIKNFCGATYRTRLDEAFHAIRHEYEAACEADDAEMGRTVASTESPGIDELPEPVAQVVDLDQGFKFGPQRRIELCWGKDGPKMPEAGTLLYGPEVAERLKVADADVDKYQKICIERGSALIELTGQTIEWVERAMQAESRLQAMTAALREPTNETLGAMMDTWNNAFGSPYTRYAAMLNVAVDAALLRSDGEGK